jgi:NAD(P)H-hydrate repair Nnr-like enzyme with NAD(P)H-hydrate epimerase domain
MFFGIQTERIAAEGPAGLWATCGSGDVGGDAPGLVAGEEMRRRASPLLILAITLDSIQSY